MKTRDLVFEIAAIARKLANQRIDELRYTAAEGSDTWAQAQREMKHMSRGELIEKILIEEFELGKEFPDES